MTEKTKAQCRRGVAKGFQKQNYVETHYTEDFFENQVIIEIGQELCDEIKQLKRDIVGNPYTVELSRLVDACDVILDAAGEPIMSQSARDRFHRSAYEYRRAFRDEIGRF